MKKVILFISLLCLVSCELLDNGEKKAIEIVKRTKVQTDGVVNLFNNLQSQETWLDYANNYAQSEPNRIYTWTASITGTPGVILVSFLDENRWGLNWEVKVKEDLVQFVNSNEYLSRRYGLSGLDRDSNFAITNVKTDTLKFEKEYDEFSGVSNKKVVYVIKASVVNKTKKILTHAEISGQLKVIFKDKTVDSDNKDSYTNYTADFIGVMRNGFKDKISKSKPWLPESEKEFLIKTKGIEEIYLNYKPEYVILEIKLHVEDPVGFSYDKNIKELNVKKKWLALKKI